MSTLFTIQFGLSEKHRKFEKKNPRGFDKSTDLHSKRQNHEEGFFQIMCASQKSLNFNRQTKISLIFLFIRAFPSIRYLRV